MPPKAGPSADRGGGKREAVIKPASKDEQDGPLRQAEARAAALEKQVMSLRRYHAVACKFSALIKPRQLISTLQISSSDSKV